MKSLVQWLSKSSTLSVIALTSTFGCLVIALSDSDLRPKFFELAAANLGAYIALQRGGSPSERSTQTEEQRDATTKRTK